MQPSHSLQGWLKHVPCYWLRIHHLPSSCLHHGTSMCDPLLPPLPSPHHIITPSHSVFTVIPSVLLIMFCCPIGQYRAGDDRCDRSSGPLQHVSTSSGVCLLLLLYAHIVSIACVCRQRKSKGVIESLSGWMFGQRLDTYTIGKDKSA